MNIDVIVLAVLAVFFFFVSYRYGKTFLTAFVLAFYPTYFLFDLLKEKVSSKEPIVIVGLFVVCFALVMYILRRTIAAGFSFMPGKRIIDSILLALGAISQCAFVYYFTLPQLGDLYNLSKTVDTFFNGTIPYILLATIPFIALVVAAKD
jgi:hypothetical protein